MKYTLLILTTAVLLSAIFAYPQNLAAQEATYVTINFANLELSATPTENSSASVIDEIADTVTTSYMYVSDYDGLGGDDTITFDLVATFTGTTDGAQLGSASAVNYIIEPGQTITFSIENITYTRAYGMANSAIFNGFYEVSVGGNVSGDFTSQATGDSYLGLSGTGVAITLATFEPIFDLTLDSGASGSKVFRRPDANFSLETTDTLVSPVLLGDCNQDGVVDFLDINPFITVLASSSFLEQADCNQDGIVSFLDIGPLVTLLAAQ